MHTYLLYRLSRSARLRRALDTLSRELRTLLWAFANPNRVINEVKAMRDLLQQAERIESSQPARAAVLRQQAVRVGL